MSKAKLFSPARKEAGFTLIELLTVIVIIGILAAIAIPVFTSQRARAQDSQTISDVRNIAVQAETIMSDPKSTYDDVTKANIDFASSKNVSWNISGKASLGGYCIVAKNTAGKKYTTDATALTYDSKAGGVGRSGGACDANGSTNNPVVPSGSTAVGSLVAVNAAAPTSVNASRNSQTSATVNWTIPTDTDVTGYVLQRSATTNDADFATVGTITSRTTSTFTDTSAPSTAAYYRLMSTTAAGTSSQKSNVASLGAYVVPTTTTFNANGSGQSGSIQAYTVTATGTYKIEAWGASGGNSKNGYVGGKGAYTTGVVTLTSGQVVNIMVGQKGSDSLNQTNYYNGGGGGGTFTALGTGSGATALVVAGGGQGAIGDGWANGGTPLNGRNGLVYNSGTGTFGSSSSNGCSGSGFISDGNSCGGGFGVNASAPMSYANGGTGGSVGTPSYQVPGGYGGGGASSAGSGGGGGGYTGGYGYYNTPSDNAGGGSYVINSATSSELNNTDKANTGNGKVVITRIG